MPTKDVLPTTPKEKKRSSAASVLGKASGKERLPPRGRVALKVLSVLAVPKAPIASKASMAGRAFRAALGEDFQVLSYSGSKNLDAFVHVLTYAPPMQILETERRGVSARFLTDMARRMDVPFTHLAESVGIPKTTAVRKQEKNELIDGAAAIALARLLAIANEIVEDSTVPEAKKFDTAKWLGQWIERPQPALGGRKPSELLDTPTGVAMVTKVLGAIRSGAYQ